MSLQIVLLKHVRLIRNNAGVSSLQTAEFQHGNNTIQIINQHFALKQAPLLNLPRFETEIHEP